MIGILNILNDSSMLIIFKDFMSRILVIAILLIASTNAVHLENEQQNGALLSMFYCGFSGDFCGQSTTDDVNAKATTIILAFANSASNGSVVVDDSHFPITQVKTWQSKGKKVLLSIGGQNGNWNVIFASQQSRANFINSLKDHVNKYKLDGVDLDIQGYNSSPRTVANTIIDLKKALNTLGKKLLVVSPECVTVYQGSPVPNPDVGGNPFNYFVPIINLADAYIDYYQPQAYNNWYQFPGGSLQYLQDIYLNWRNMKGLSPWTNPLPNFSGVKGEKLLMGVLASSSAGGAAYYTQPSTIANFRKYLADNKYPLAGFMMWDSHWDQLNNFQISNACTA